MDDSTIVIIITAASLVAFAFEVLSIDLVAIGIVVALILTGVLEPGEAIAGFGDKAVVVVGALLVLSQGVLRTGALGFLARQFAIAARSSPMLAFPFALLVVMAGSAFMNNTPIVVVFIPIFLGLAREFRTFPSRILIPLSYASIMGGACTLIGSSANVIASSVTESHRFAGQNYAPISMFELTPFGLVQGVVGFFYLGLAYRFFLPDRKTITSYLGPESAREFVTEVAVKEGSRLIGRKLAETPLGRAGELRVLQLLRGEEVRWTPLGEVEIELGDLLIVKGNPNAILDLTETQGIQILPEIAEGTLRFDRKRMVLTEIVIMPNTRWVDRPLREVRFSKRFGVTVVAILRHGQHLREKIAGMYLRAGDVLLAFADESRISDLRESDEFLLMEGVHETVLNGRKAPVALGILGLIVAAFASGEVSLVGAALAGAFLTIAMGCLTPRQAYSGIDWSILILMGGTLSLGVAFEKTGLAATIGGQLVDWLLPFGLVAVLSGFYLLTSLLAEVLTRTAAVVLLVPIAISAAQEAGAGADPRNFIFAVIFGASAVFATPVSYNTNALVYGPGGYRYVDYVKVGLPLKLILWLVWTAFVAILIAPGA